MTLTTNNEKEFYILTIIQPHSLTILRYYCEKKHDTKLNTIITVNTQSHSQTALTTVRKNTIQN